jgi:hypothetical protein
MDIVGAIARHNLGIEDNAREAASNTHFHEMKKVSNSSINHQDNFEQIVKDALYNDTIG